MNYSDKRVLIVDDQRPFLTLLRGVVNNMGAQSVVAVQNADSALAACKKEKFDFIICDLHLGSGKKNGYQFLEEARQKNLVKPETVFAVVSADSERPVVFGSVEQHPDDYLIKPFSQAQLNLRLSKAYQKRLALRPVYEAMQKNDIPEAIAACRRLIMSGTRYAKTCCRLLAELYWKAGEFTQAKHMLTPLLAQKPQPWVTIALAKTEMLMTNYDAAIELAIDMCHRNPLLYEAQDILAQCYLLQGDYPNALTAIDRAIEIAPYSVERQLIACKIARENHNYEMVKLRSLDVWELSKKSIHRDIAHLCSYFRSILDAAEHCEDKNMRSRYQHEMMTAIARYRNDEALARIDEDFDYGIYENILTARINYLDGRLLEAKRTLNECQQQIAIRFTDYPTAFAPDSIKVMLDLGEYDDAERLSKTLTKSGKQLDESTLFSLKSSVDKAAQRRHSYQNFNKQGIEHYNSGRYQEAYNAFLEAQKVAPVNTGIALNILQCNLKLIAQMKKPETRAINALKQMYRHLKNMVMLESHQQKFESLKSDLGKYVEVA
ncbi:Alkaline phosphatase synthesis transcriptional regulatory protein PhoP [Paraglaciecola mesophila]|uniref:Alkaline phosphatase synthesis transcriptional regulatory protein PhoP n=1 Tax=Paraglaciecola mesophila TaxID=197222 RepID=A0A857JFP9_9ALTE|nr:response regulator [Paraglaciecola mesophila]QHJ09801.1 Alkaline phosphatase synthesis transcriptional regulatory protein PhoP [Paraglaciecola mesophila]